MANKKAEEYNYIRKSFVFDGERYFVRGKTEEEAIEKKIELKKKLERGERVNQHLKSQEQKRLSGDMSVKDYSEVWLDTYVKPKIRKAGASKQKGTISQKSYEMYTQKLDGYILPSIGNMKLKRVTDTNLQAILNEEKKNGLSYSTCNKIKIVMNANNWRSFTRQVDLAMGAETTAHGHIYDPKDIDKNGVPLYPDDNGNPRNGHKIADDLVLYCLRHTYCTDLQKKGVPLNIAKYLMGHSDIAVTASIYTHTGADEAIAAGQIIDLFDSKAVASV